METIDLFSAEIQNNKNYIHVGNVETENADKRIIELNPIRAICTADAVDIYGSKLPTHKAVRIHKDDYSSYNDLMIKNMRNNYQWN